MVERLRELQRTAGNAAVDEPDGGLTWLGDATVAHGCDIMHFDTRGAGPIKRIWKSASGDWTSLGEG